MARFHRLMGLVGVAFLGVAGCNLGGGGEKGTAGGGKGGTPGAPGGNEVKTCLGPTWFGAIDESKRAHLIDVVCADARSSKVPTARLGEEAGPSCKGVFDVKSDDELTSVVESVNNGLSQVGSIGEANATSPQVKDMASVIRAAHTRDAEMDKRMLARKNARPAENEISRSLAKGFEDNDNALRNLKGEEFDRELVDRVIIQHARAAELFDALAPQAKEEDLRCAVENDRNASMDHLALACQTRAGLAPATMTRPKHPGRIRSTETTVAPAKLPPTLAPVQATTPAPAQAPTPAPAQASTPAPAQASTPAPAQASTPAPAQASTPAPAQASTPAPAQASMPAPAQSSTPAPTQASTPAPTQASTPAPEQASTPAPEQASTPASPMLAPKAPPSATPPACPDPPAADPAPAAPVTSDPAPSSPAAPVDPCAPCP